MEQKISKKKRFKVNKLYFINKSKHCPSLNAQLNNSETGSEQNQKL